MRAETLWTFSTARFRVVCEIEPDFDLDLSFDDTGEVAEKLESGEYTAFQTRVAVYLDGNQIAADYLGGSIYANPEDFVTDHRDPDPMNRNSSLMRAERGDNVSICHYFPGMVSEAIAEARKALSNVPTIRAA